MHPRFHVPDSRRMKKRDGAGSRRLRVNHVGSGINLEVISRKYGRAWQSRVKGVVLALFGCLIVLGGSARAARPRKGRRRRTGSGIRREPRVARSPPRPATFAKHLRSRSRRGWLLEVTADNAFTLYLDGNQVAAASDGRHMQNSSRSWRSASTCWRPWLRTRPPARRASW